MSNNIRVFTSVALIFCVLTVAAAIAGGINFYSPVPFWDMWGGYLDFYTKIATGNYSAWWAQHSEHRIVLARIFFWMDIRWFGGQSYFLIVINYILLSAACATLLLFLNDTFKSLPKKELRNFFALITIGWLFSWAQHENLSWGFQSQFFMAQLLPLCAFYFLYKMSSTPNKSREYFLLASFFGVLSVGTMANGILALPLMLVYGIFCKIGSRRCGALLILTVISVFFYYHDYNSPSGHGSLSNAVLTNPVGVVHYVLLYIGSPFFYITPLPIIAVKEGVALLAGSFFVASAAYYAFTNIRAAQKNYLHLGLLFFILYIGGTALGTAGGRLIFGVEQAMSSRYTTPAFMAWAALLIIATPVLVAWTGKTKAILAVLLLLSFSVLVGQASALKSPDNEKFDQMVAALGLELKVNDQSQISHVYPVSETALAVAKFPAENHLSIFGSPPLLGAMEKIGTVNPIVAEKQCLGNLDQVEPIIGEARYASVTGWFFDMDSESVPQSLLIVDQKNVVVGYALVGGERNDVALLIDSKAKRSQFKGYVLKSSLGSVLKIVSKIPRCYINAPTSAFSYTSTIVNADVNATTLTTANVLDSSTWTGTDGWHSKIDGLAVMGSWKQSDADTGFITLHIKRGDKLLYRSGPTGGRQMLEVNDDPKTISPLPVAVAWVALDFSDSKYPDSFKIKISDAGDGWGEWSAIALKTEHK